MTVVHEDYKNQTMLRVHLKGDDLEKVIAEYAAKVTGCSLQADNVKVETVRVREPDRGQYRDSATAEVHLVILHTPGAIDAWVERREREAAERRAQLPAPSARLDELAELELRRARRVRLTWLRRCFQVVGLAVAAGILYLAAYVAFFR